MKIDKTIALVGLMGVGKSSIGRRLAYALGLSFMDSDQELETAAGCSIVDIYERWGVEAFQDAEKRVIKRLLSKPPHVLSTGEGTFVVEETRDLLKSKALTIWLKADLETIYQRVKHRNTRPRLLEGDPFEILQKLEREREHLYAQADLTIESQGDCYEQTVSVILDAIHTKGLQAR